MARIEKSPIGQTPFQQLLGYNPNILEAWGNLAAQLEREGSLSAELKEQVRRTLAQGNGCAYCKAKGKPDQHHVDEKTVLATGFADVFLKNRDAIDDKLFQLLREQFSTKEISELCAFIAFTTAQQYYGAMMGLEAESPNS